MAGVIRMIWMTVLLIAAPLARGAVIELVNTFPAPGEPFRSAYPVAAPGGEWWELAVPFSVPVPGYLRRIETGLHFSEGGTAAIEVYLAGGAPFGTTFDSGEYGGVDVGDILVPDTRVGRDWCRFRYGADVRCVRLDDFEAYRWRGSALAAPGEYWVVTRIPMEDVFGGWYANPGLLRDDFATRSRDIGRALGIFADYEAVPWMRVSDMGPDGRPGGAYPAPVIRVLFQPLVVREPGALLLLLLGLAGVALGSRRSVRTANGSRRVACAASRKGG